MPELTDILIGAVGTVISSIFKELAGMLSQLLGATPANTVAMLLLAGGFGMLAWKWNTVSKYVFWAFVICAVVAVVRALIYTN